MKKNSVIFLVFISVFSYSQDIVINEILSSNTSSSLQDEDGDYSDWIELYNTSSSPINLENYSLSDEEIELAGWIFPSVIIAPHDYLIVFASGKDRSASLSELHTDFRIKAQGEKIKLFNAAHVKIDEFPKIQLLVNKSYGRSPDGSDSFGVFIVPSPLQTNNEEAFIQTIHFSNKSGFYKKSFYLKMSCEDSIYYTLNGSVPTINSILYTDSIYINADFPNKLSLITTTSIPYNQNHYINREFGFYPPKKNIDKAIVLRAVRIKDGEIVSEVYNKTYWTNNDAYSIPVISLITDSLNFFDDQDGIYVPGFNVNGSNSLKYNYNNRGFDWERSGNIEYFNTDQVTEFSADVGLRISGALSRRAPQKSLRIYFREEYGYTKIDYPFFYERKNDSYNRLILRSSFTYWWGKNTLFQDDLLHSIVEKSGSELDVQMSQPVILFINGEYWGVQNIRERQDEHYLNTMHGVNKDSVNIINGNMQADIGSAATYIELVGFIENVDLQIEANYEYVSTQLDIDNFIDYFIFETYFGNRDWPANNFRLWRSQAKGEKWKCLLYDLDGSIGSVEYNPFKHLKESDVKPAMIFNSLLLNETFKTAFISRYIYFLKIIFKPENIFFIQREFIATYQEEIGGHIDRWNNPSTFDSWEYGNRHFKEFMNERPCLIKEMLIDFFDLNDLDEFDCHYQIETDELLVFPNPNNGDFTIVMDTDKSIRGDIIVFNATGQQVFTQAVVDQKYQEFKLDFLNAGIYYVRITANEITQTEKVIIY